MNLLGFGFATRHISLALRPPFVFGHSLVLFDLLVGLVVMSERAQVATRSDLAAFSTIVGCPSFTPLYFFSPERCVLLKHIRFHYRLFWKRFRFNHLGVCFIACPKTADWNCWRYIQFHWWYSINYYTDCDWLPGQGR